MSTYCPLPFKHVFVETKGIKPCCSYTKVFSGTIQDWINSDELAQLQSDLLNNRYNDGCISCLEADAVDKFSTRTTAFADYGPTIYDHTDIDYVDLRSSNVCNFKCRSCEPSYSSKITAEIRRNPKLAEFYSPVELLPQEQNTHWILNNLSTLTRIMFTGGEPTQIPVVKQLLLEISTLNLTDINIQIVSNGSFTDKFWFDITKELSNVNWVISLDACSKQAELIRDGTQWDLISNNIEKLFDVAHSINISTVVTTLNVLHLSELFWFINHMRQLKINTGTSFGHSLSICNYPKHFSPYNWPDDLKSKVIEKIKSALNNAQLDTQKNTLNILLKNIQHTEFNAALWDQFMSHNQAIDDIRNQNFFGLLIEEPLHA